MFRISLYDYKQHLIYQTVLPGDAGKKPYSGIPGALRNTPFPFYLLSHDLSSDQASRTTKACFDFDILDT